MAVRPILHAPDPRLKVKAAPVITVDDSVRLLMDDMLETMYRAPGIGLAAPQIGISQRVIVIDLAETEHQRQPLRMVNPEIIAVSEESQVFEEGCLSLPDQYAEVERPAKIRVRYLDYAGASQELEAEGLLATCILHEIDHLDGVLFVDRISSLRRSIIIRKLAKRKKSLTAEVA
ncbi:MAG: peptide deformylase [Alphaproteobacteria bacterium]